MFCFAFGKLWMLNDSMAKWYMKLRERKEMTMMIQLRRLLCCLKCFNNCLWRKYTFYFIFFFIFCTRAYFSPPPFSFFHPLTLTLAFSTISDNDYCQIISVSKCKSWTFTPKSWEKREKAIVQRWFLIIHRSLKTEKTFLSLLPLQTKHL